MWIFPLSWIEALTLSPYVKQKHWKILPLYDNASVSLLYSSAGKSGYDGLNIRIPPSWAESIS